jgi:hypothetical protein
MASNAKRKTTMAKLNRETKLRERRQAKEARKEARKYEAAHPETVQQPDAEAEATVPPAEES